MLRHQGDNLREALTIIVTNPCDHLYGKPMRDEDVRVVV